MRVPPELNIDELRHFTKIEIAERAKVSVRVVERDSLNPTCPLSDGGRFAVRAGAKVKTCDATTLRDYLLWRIEQPAQPTRTPPKTGARG